MSELAQRLAAAGFVAPDEEAAELIAAARGDDDQLEELVARRLTGEPLAWITGTVSFCGLTIGVSPGVYVPRWHSEALAEYAAAALPPGGVGIDVCTGSGAIAAVLGARRPEARVVATDIDPNAVRCAGSNGVEAYAGDLFAPAPQELRGRVDVVTGVVPYVPTAELTYLQRDTFTFEGTLGYHGGEDGLEVFSECAREARRWLKPDGTVGVEVGSGQEATAAEWVQQLGYTRTTVIRDDEGNVRGISARSVG